MRQTRQKEAKKNLSNNKWFSQCECVCVCVFSILCARNNPLFYSCLFIFGFRSLLLVEGTTVRPKKNEEKRNTRTPWNHGPTQGVYSQANIGVAVAAAAKPHSTPYKYVVLYTLQETMLDFGTNSLFVISLLLCFSVSLCSLFCGMSS